MIKYMDPTVILNLFVVGVIAAVAAPFIIKANKSAQVENKIRQLTGDTHRTPQPLTVGLPRDKTIDRFLQALGQTPGSHGWAVTQLDKENGAVAASMTMCNSVTINSESELYAIVATNLVLRAQFVNRGSACTIKWMFDENTSCTNMPGYPVADPAVPKVCQLTNHQILKDLGVLDGSVEVFR